MLYGYDKKEGKLIINEEEAEMIRLIFKKYATGTWSTPKIEKLLYENGYLTLDDIRKTPQEECGAEFKRRI